MTTTKITPAMAAALRRLARGDVRPINLGPVTKQRLASAGLVKYVDAFGGHPAPPDMCMRTNPARYQRDVVITDDGRMAVRALDSCTSSPRDAVATLLAWFNNRDECPACNRVGLGAPHSPVCVVTEAMAMVCAGEKACAVCGVEFTAGVVVAGRRIHRDRKYCSNRCRNAAQRIAASCARRVVERR